MSIALYAALADYTALKEANVMLPQCSGLSVGEITCGLLILLLKQVENKRIDELLLIFLSIILSYPTFPVSYAFVQ